MDQTIMINEDKRLKVVYQLSWACFVNDPWLTRSRGKLPRDQQLQMLHYDFVKLVVTRIAGPPPFHELSTQRNFLLRYRYNRKDTPKVI